jgi:hypothetical protein
MSRRIGDAMGIIVNPAGGMFISKNGDKRNGMFIETFETGWVYDMPKEGAYHIKEEPKKDGFYDHLMDALGYAFIDVFPLLKGNTIARKSKPKRKFLHY